MKKLWVLLVTVFLLSGFNTIQDKTITGKVTCAEDGTGLPGVNVIVKGTSIGVTTNADGEYEITIPAGNQMLVFSFIGLQTKEIVPGDRTVVNISLKQDPAQLSETVVMAVCFERERQAVPSAPATKRKASRRSKQKPD
ncbi:MAG TPA: carboxypeptidase-like regulatory domain-containing protein [Chryseosolibacter sp.]